MQELFHHFVQSPDPRSANEKDIASGQDIGMNSTRFLLKITEDRSNGEVECAMCEFPKLFFNIQSIKVGVADKGIKEDNKPNILNKRLDSNAM